MKRISLVSLIQPNKWQTRFLEVVRIFRKKIQVTCSFISFLIIIRKRLNILISRQPIEITQEVTLMTKFVIFSCRYKICGNLYLFSVIFQIHSRSSSLLPMLLPEWEHSEKDMQETTSGGCRSCRNPIDTNVSSRYAHRLDEFQSCNLLGLRYSNGGAKLSNGRRWAESERRHVRAKRAVRIR